jgi:hypothetical protein
MWDEVVQLASTVSLDDSDGALIWKFSSNGVYSVQSLYKVINFRGIKPILVSSILEVNFSWILSKNKLLTRDNLGKRRKVENDLCLFCDEKESVQHLFFDCVVSKQLWCCLSKIFQVHLGDSLDSVGRFWLSNKQNGVLNMVSSAAFWSVWKLRNDICFQRTKWKGMDILLHKVASLVQNWIILCREEKRVTLQAKIGKIKVLAGQVLWLPYRTRNIN